MEQKTIFRRVNGRIIPMRVSGETKERVKGTAIAAAGVTTSIAGGNIYRKTVLKSAAAGLKGFQTLDKALSHFGPRQMHFNDLAKRAAMSQKATEFLRKGTRLAGFSKVIRKISPALGAGLIGFGTLKVASTFKQDKKSKISPEMVAGGSAAAGVFAPKAYEFSTAAFNAGMHGRQGAFGFAKSNWSAAAPKLKDLAIKFTKAKGF